ncbi:MAG TPA: hypothetical protein VFX30_01880 [bacterium]|nr:hypothetical protein [bacterium]
MKTEANPWVIRDITSDHEAPEAREALRLESEGALAAGTGRAPWEDRTGSVLPPVLDLKDLTAETFLEAVRAGEIESRGGKKKGLEAEAFFFLQEACSELKTSTPPVFVKSVASSWARLSQGRASPEIVSRIARRSAVLLTSLWKLGHAGHLTHSILETSLHRIDIPAFLRLKGWLSGESRRLPEASAALLQKNMGTILTRALKTCDLAYVPKAARAVPEMLQMLEDLVARMRISNEAIVREAADLLGGADNARWRGNFGSVVNHAVASGRLTEYVRQVELRFAGGEILREIEDGIRDLGGNTEEAVTLKNNKASILSRALHHGRLNYRAQWKLNLQKIGVAKLKKMRQLEDENRRLKNLVANLSLEKAEDADDRKKS